MQTFEVGGDGDEHYLVMEYLEGQSLDRLVRRAPADGPRLLPCLLRALCDALGGLHYAHELCDFDGTPLNVVHRDVSPRNVFVTYEGVTKVLDFGIAKVLRASHVSRAGTLKGTVRYMAPEQVLGLDIDRRADLFAAGVILWEIVSGRRMWPGLDDIVILQRLLQGQIPSLGEAKSDAPPELARVCARALAVKPADRYPSALHMRAELEAAMAALGLGSTHAELSGLIVNVFRDEREALRRLIEEQFARASEGSLLSAAGGAFAGGARPGDSAPPHGAGPAAPPYGAGGAVLAAEAFDTPPSTLPDAALAAAPSTRLAAGYSAPPPGSYTTGGVTASPAGAGRRRLPMHFVWPAGIAAIALAAFGTGRLGARHGSPAGLVTAETSVALAEALSAPAPPSPTPATVNLRVDSRPAQAKVYLDDRPVGDTPLKVAVPRGGEHALRLEAPGQQALARQVSLEHDVTLELLLSRAAPAGNASSHPAHAAKGKAERPDAADLRLLDAAPPAKRGAPLLDKSSPYPSTP